MKMEKLRWDFLFYLTHSVSILDTKDSRVLIVSGRKVVSRDPQMSLREKRIFHFDSIHLKSQQLESDMIRFLYHITLNNTGVVEQGVPSLSHVKTRGRSWPRRLRYVFCRFLRGRPPSLLLWSGSTLLEMDPAWVLGLELTSYGRGTHCRSSNMARQQVINTWLLFTALDILKPNQTNTDH